MNFGYFSSVCKPGTSVVVCLPLSQGSYTVQKATVVRLNSKLLEVCMEETGNMASFGVPKGRRVFGRICAKTGLFAPVNLFNADTVYDSTFVPSFSYYPTK